MNKKEIGNTLKMYRKLAGLTQEELAEIVNIHEKQISRIESGIHFPTFDNFVKIMNALKIDFSDLSQNNKENLNLTKRKLFYILNNSNEEELKVYLRIIEDIKNLKK